MNASWQIQADIGFHLGRAYTVHCSKKWANIYLYILKLIYFSGPMNQI